MRESCMLSSLVIYTERKSSEIMGVPSDQVTKEGYDLQFATNVLYHVSISGRATDK